MIQQPAGQRRDLGARMHQPQALRREDRGIGGRRIETVRAGNHPAVQPRRLKRIMSPHRHQRAADEGKRREAIEQAELAQRVGDVNLGVGLDRLAQCAARRLACVAQHRDVGPARGVARHDDRQQFGMRAPQRVMRRQDRLVLAGMGLRRQQHRPHPDHGFQRREFRRIEGQRRRVFLQAPDHAHIRRAQYAEARRDLLVLRQADVEGRQDRFGRLLRPAPALEGSLRHPRIDQRQPGAPCLRAKNKVRPKIGIDEQSHVGPPMLEEPPRRARRVDRHELMDRAGRQPPFHQLGGGDRPAGHQHGRALGRQRLDQRQRRQAFAIARAMHPDKLAIRPRHAGMAQPFRRAVAMLLAAPPAPAQQHRRRRRQKARRCPIEDNTHRRHAQLVPASVSAKSY